VGLQEHFGALFAELPAKLRRNAPFSLPANYAAAEEEEEAKEAEEDDDDDAKSEAADEAKKQGLAACGDFVLKLFPGAKV
jgi:hypothetical protein